jgi:hypothetical protein
MALPLVTFAQYQALTQQYVNDLLQQEFQLTNLDTYINIARGQLAAAAQCIRYTGTFDTTAGMQSYPIAGISTPAGVASALTVRMVSSGIANAGQIFLEMRPWEWAWFYWFSRPFQTQEQPRGWSIQEPGPAGSLFLYPTPDMAYTLYADCVGLPVQLSGAEGEIEAIPYPWTDSVPYFAAYLAFVSVNRWADAQQMLMRWEGFAAWAVKTVIPQVLPSYAPGGLGAAQAAMHMTNTGFGAPTGGGRGGAA